MERLSPRPVETAQCVCGIPTAEPAGPHTDEVDWLRVRGPGSLRNPTPRLKLYDVRGALIREIDLGYRAADQYLTSANAAHWDGRDQRGQCVSSGVYLYRLQAGPVAHVLKMVLVK